MDRDIAFTTVDGRMYHVYYVRKYSEYQEVPEQSLLAQFFFGFHDFFFFFIEEKPRRFLSLIFFDLSSSNFFLQFSLNFS